VNIFSDGAVSQFEQRFSFANLTFLSNDYDPEMGKSRLFQVTSHAKSL